MKFFANFFTHFSRSTLILVLFFLPLMDQNILIIQSTVHERYGVDITPLTYIPGGRIDKYLGNLNFFFIRESTSIRENGGISGFVHSFITELLAVVRSHITALGGNAMVSFYMSELILVDNPHKNQVSFDALSMLVINFNQFFSLSFRTGTNVDQRWR